jgi:Protein of unknown function (DUF3142)
MIRFLTLCCAASLAAAATPPPKLVLWSWYAEEDLRFVKDNDIGVAYRALSLRFEGRDRVLPEPRFAPLRLSPDTWQMVVVRCDYDTQSRPAFSAEQRRLAAAMIAEIVAVSGVPAVQIDFDAPQSAYPFYRQLLADVRDRLGPNIFLSMTALVSWCESPQSWLAGAPVDEIVPMAFHMGRAEQAVVTMLQRGGQFAFPGCRGSLGLELAGLLRPRRGERTYFFGQWTPTTVQSARREVLR